MVVEPSMWAQRYSIDSPTASSCIQPPAGVDLTKLSDSQLAEYGLPNRPSDPLAYAQWATMLHHAQHRVCQLVPTDRHFTSQENSPSWAGNIGTGGSYNWVSANWNIPCLGSSVKGSDSGLWVGLGGDNYDGGGNLVQAGTEQGYDISGFKYYNLWIEDYPYNSEQVIQGIQPNCNDQMYVYVSSDYDVGGQVYYAVDDESQGFYYGQNFAWPLSNGSTSEWIVERPGSYLSNFGSATFTYCETGQHKSRTVEYVGQIPHNYAVMWSRVVNGQGQGNELAYPQSIINNSQFTVQFVHSS